jgi:tetratricopeptide (TPR) repeat protein
MAWSGWRASSPRRGPVWRAAAALTLGLLAAVAPPAAAAGDRPRPTGIDVAGAAGVDAAAAPAVCEDWVAVAVSIQGSVQARRLGEPGWVRARPEDRYCAGDMVRVDARSRAAVRLRSGAVLRLDQNTTITLQAERRAASWIEVLLGAVYFAGRVVRELTVLTPFVNGAVEGTEFLVEVTADEARLTVVQGRVTASSPAGTLALSSGQSAVARAGQPPALRPIRIVPADLVQWALYYPPLVSHRPADFPDRPGETWPAQVRGSIEAAAAGDLEAAFARLAAAPPGIADPRFYTYRAGLLLAVGRVDEAGPDIERALGLAPEHGEALGLRAVVLVAKNDAAEARRVALRATRADPRSAGAFTALAYAQQASADLPAARAAAERAAALRPDDGLVRARLAELLLAFRELDRARETATAAAAAEPRIARPQTVLGFVHLARIRTAEARAAFERAAALDPADPWPRLGLGLAAIREGRLEAGRRELEVALSLDPASALLRSYLGKAYHEEWRDGAAAEQLALAEALDPADPTAWFYDALRKQSVNRPGEALGDLERAVALNDNRAVYRSRLSLDEDRAVRGASLARIYDDLGFPQRALVEGWRSLALDPGNYSAHRFLADSYAVLPRHEVARVSELLQAQLLQPLNVVPVQPQLGLSRSFILTGAGPATPAFNEFNALFERDRLALLASGLAGSSATYGDEVVVSGLWDRVSFSLGQLHYETDGFRPNSDQTQDVYDVFGQVSLSPATSVLAEFRSIDFERGDLVLRFDPENFVPTLRQRDRVESYRVGVRHAVSPRLDLLATGSYLDADFEALSAPGVGVRRRDDGYTAEGLVLWRTPSVGVDVAAGGGYFDADRETTQALPFGTQTTRGAVRHTHLYLYAYVRLWASVTVTLGAGGDFLDGVVRRDQANPKLGVTWNPVPATTVRGALFRTLKRPLVADQTIEPTQVGGFNQLFDDPEGTEAWRAGLGVDQRLAAGLYAGAEVSGRDLTVPVVEITPAGTAVRRDDWEEQLGRAYLYWLVHPRVAVTAEYLFERFERDRAARNPEAIATARTHRAPFGVSLFLPAGLTARLKATYVHQSGDFGSPAGDVVRGRDDFWVIDAALSYRLPRRWGIVTVEARNLFDQTVRFQDTSPGNPVFHPERLILARFTLAY